NINMAFQGRVQTSSQFQIRSNHRQILPIHSNTFQCNRGLLQCILLLAGLGIEVFITPNPTSSKQAYIQVDEVVSALVNGGISIRSLWIQATSPINWNGNQATNLNFINSAIQRIRARGIRPGVYTNNYDWQQITNQAGNLGSTGTSTHQESEAKPRPISMISALRQLEQRISEAVRTE
ncbi:hypothetical protein PENTCL1PPCAC_8859, partial [Pristionchus entomophagus]